ncbi:hypothetical protein EPN52_00185 [bacterium]|nr:MAG: hypothetical protein EPN52_00185 [bacterium]
MRRSSASASSSSWPSSTGADRSTESTSRASSATNGPLFALIVADDLTGAAEVAAALARAAGVPQRIVLSGRAPHVGDVVLLPVRRGGTKRARLLAQNVALPGQGMIFVKIDSTLRGPWVELVETLATRLGAEPLLCPAFPARGRTLENGLPMVEGVPLFESTSLAELIAARAPALRCSIPDARSDDDLDAVARGAAAAERRLVVGSAGLAEAFARVTGSADECAPLADAPAARGPVVVAAGSRAAATARQVAQLGDRAVVLRGKALRMLARAAVEAAHGGTLIACGGETALQILHALRVRVLMVYGEVAPAVVLARPRNRDLTLLTKSGSLGQDDALVAALEALALLERRGA